MQIVLPAAAISSLCPLKQFGTGILLILPTPMTKSRLESRIANQASRNF